MKKILSIIISVVFILGLFSCTTTTPNTTTKIQIKVEENVLTWDALANAEFALYAISNSDKNAATHQEGKPYDYETYANYFGKEEYKLESTITVHEDKTYTYKCSDYYKTNNPSRLAEVTEEYELKPITGTIEKPAWALR